MYLKSIDMYGFKSFANKIVFTFDEGITAIVGPNGSGKSNIADAVRWVLGEQSAKSLRGSSMKDIIFAGTESRRPLGYCQVDLTIDNGDRKMAISFSEVTVSRRVYRSGESEYYINGTACRLKDVHELFMDTGVGKEGYSIIGQGQIDKILSTKPDDRRGLFDEAAGIVKYKKRKDNAEKQLEEEEINLVRINDIIQELSNQEVTLREQSETAKVYLQYKEELKKNEVNIYVNEVNSMDNRIASLVEKENIVTEQIENAAKEKTNLSDKQTELKDESEAVDNEISENQATSTQIAVEKEKRESTIKVTKEQIINIKTNIDRISLENQSLNKKLVVKQEELDGYEVQLKNVKDDTGKQLQTLEDYEKLLHEKNLSIQGKENLIESIQTDMIERLNDISLTKSKILRFNTILENITQRIALLKERKKDYNISLTNIKETSLKSQNELDSIEKKRINFEHEKSALKLEFTSLLKERDEIIAELNLLKSDANRFESKHKALLEIADNYDGYQYSIKSIMTLRGSDNPLSKGILGVVADLIEVDKTYEKAVEIALGSNIQNVVTDHEDTAKALIKYLKENRFGRATFLPITTIKAQQPNKVIDSNEPGFLGYGNKVVSCDKAYSHIVDYLLGRIGIVKDLEAGIKISKKHHFSVRLVTLAGEVINPGGSMTGGAFKNDGNQFLSRKRQIEELELSIKNAQDMIGKKEKSYDEHVKNVELLNNRLSELGEKEQELSIEFNRVAIELKQYENDFNKQEAELKAVNDELNQLLEQEQTLNQNVTDLEETLGGTEGTNKAQEDQVKSLLDHIQKEKSEKEVVSDTLTKLKVEASASQAELNHIKENRERVAKELDELNSQIISNNDHIMTNEVDITDKTLIIEKLLEASNDSDHTIKEKEAYLKSLNDRKHNLANEREALYKKREQVNDEINQLDKELLRLQNQKESLENTKNDQAIYMWNEYEITINNAEQYQDENLGTLTEMRKSIKDLRNDIKDLGPVNVNAIEEYKAVSERFEFLSSQRDDLIESKEKIIGVIEELKEDMETQFRQKFKEISKKFTEVFKELFGGGKAFLELVEDDDILETGIEIIAQPPGKKLQSMALLSGGEKAFTAISLLFAIQSLKPSPFCVLDEIEAALDDANVIRFANYLRKLTANTQFIIITHRKGTMEVADALYGITMQEKGISTQVSVKLLEDSILE